MTRTIRFQEGMRELVPLLFIGVILFVIAMRYLALGPNEEVPLDFSKYVQARDWFLAGQDPYQMITGLHAFKYSPGFLSLLTLLPGDWREAWSVFGGISLLIFGLVWIVAIRVESKGRRPESVLWRIAVGFLLGWKGVIESLDYGQTEIFLFGLCVTSLMLARRLGLLSGVLFSIVLSVKLTWLALVPLFWLLGKSNRDRIIWTTSLLIASVVLGVVLPAWMGGFSVLPSLYASWFSVLSTQSIELFSDPSNQSLASTLYRSLASFDWPWAVFVGLSWMSLSLVFARTMEWSGFEVSRDVGIFRLITPWLLLLSLMSPLGWRWSSLFLITLPFSMNRKKHLGFWLILLVIAVFWLGQQNPVVRLFGLDHWSDLHHYGWVTFYWLAGLLAVLGTHDHSSETNIRTV